MSGGRSSADRRADRLSRKRQGRRRRRPRTASRQGRLRGGGPPGAGAAEGARKGQSCVAVAPRCWERQRTPGHTSAWRRLAELRRGARCGSSNGSGRYLRLAPAQVAELEPEPRRGGAPARHHGRDAGVRIISVVSPTCSCGTSRGCAPSCSPSPGTTRAALLAIERTPTDVARIAARWPRMALAVIECVGPAWCSSVAMGPRRYAREQLHSARTHLEGRWQFWFIEAVMQSSCCSRPLLLRWAPCGASNAATIPFPLRLRRRPRSAATTGSDRRVPQPAFRLHGVAWFFVLGWLATARRPRRRCTTPPRARPCPGFRTEREWFIAVGIVLLIWCREVPFRGADPAHRDRRRRAW